MSLVTEDAVRGLAAFKGKDAPVVSVYLDVDGRRFPRHLDYETALERMVRRTRRASEVGDDLERITSYVKGGIDRSHTRGLAVFACSVHGLWEVLHLSAPVRNQLVVNHTPHVRQVEAIVHARPRLGVLVVDRQRARMFVFEQGELIDHTERLDRLPRHDDDQGDWDHDHVRDHLAAAAHAHLRRAAELAFAVFQDRPFDHLVLAGPGEVVAAVEPELHSYLRERVNGRATLPVSASVAEIGRASDEMAEQIERATEAALVRRLLDRAAAGNGSVTGLDAVLAALGERRVDTLVVSDRFVVGGWRCFGCDCVARRGPLCAACTQPMVRVDDVVEEAVELALLQSCRVVTCMGNPDLDVHGRVGALLRF